MCVRDVQAHALNQLKKSIETNKFNWIKLWTLHQSFIEAKNIFGLFVKKEKQENNFDEVENWRKNFLLRRYLNIHDNSKFQKKLGK